MSVITISREFGCVGDDMGERIAHGLGYHFVGKEDGVYWRCYHPRLASRSTSCGDR